MSKEASKEYVLERLAEYFEWATAYMQAVRSGDMAEAEKLEVAYEQRLKDLKGEL